MPPKAKAKAGEAGEDESWENFEKFYTKALKLYGVPKLPDMEKIMERDDWGRGREGRLIRSRIDH